jgi:hypothetical protein
MSSRCSWEGTPAGRPSAATAAQVPGARPGGFTSGHMLISCVTAVILYFLSPELLAWVSPALLGLFLSVPLSRLSGSRSIGRALARSGCCARPEELHTPALVARRLELLRQAQPLPDDGLHFLARIAKRAWRTFKGQPAAARGSARPAGSACVHGGAKARGCPHARGGARMADPGRAGRGRGERTHARSSPRCRTPRGLIPVLDRRDHSCMHRRHRLQNWPLGLAAGQAYGHSPTARFRRRRRCRRPAPAPEQPFDFAWLKGQARWLASNAYQAVAGCVPPALAKLGYDQYQSLRFRGDHALWADPGLPSACSSSTSAAVSPSRCICSKSSTARRAKSSTTRRCSNFTRAASIPRVMQDRRASPGSRAVRDQLAGDVAAFLGASYFRAVGGDTRQYGLSARALAVDTAFPRPEEFPRFTSFWFERPAKDSRAR